MEPTAVQLTLILDILLLRELDDKALYGRINVLRGRRVFYK
jgi:hypothetical protein